MLESKTPMCTIGYIAKTTRKPCCRRETARCRCNFPRWRPAASAVRAADPQNPTYLEPNMKWIRSPVEELWPFEIHPIKRGAVYFGTAFWGKEGRRGSSMVPLERVMVVSYTLRPIATIVLSLTIRPKFCHGMSATLKSTGDGVSFGLAPWSWGLQRANTQC